MGKNRIFHEKMAEEISKELFNQWVECIQEDDSESMENIIGSSDPNIRKILLHGNLKKWQLHPCGHSNDCNCYSFYIRDGQVSSLNIAVILRAKRITKVLIDQGVDIQSQDSYGYNIIHNLVSIALCRNSQSEYVTFYNWLSNVIKPKDFRELLSQTDLSGFLPLELAAELGLYEFFMTIMNTKHVYLYKEESRWLMRYRWFDVTDYEHPDSSRRLMSPLNIISYVPPSALSQYDTKRFLSSQIIEKWFANKFQAVKRALIFFLGFHVLRMLLIAQFSFSSFTRQALFPGTCKHTSPNSNSNSTYCEYQDCQNNIFSLNIEIALTFVLLIVCLTSGVLTASYIFSLLFSRRRKSKQSKVHRFRAPLLFYPWIEVFLNSLMIIKVIGTFVAYYQSVIIPAPLIHGFDIIFTFLMIWSIFYWIQLSPIGHFVVMVQHMLKDLLNFTAVFLVFQTSFAACFFMNLTNYATECDKGVPGFSRLTGAVFSIYQVMVNTLTLGEYEVDKFYVLNMLHIVYVVLVPILLLNLLIATFSESVARLSPFKEDIIVIHKHLVAIHGDYFLSKYFSSFYIHRLEKVFAHENGRFYLVTADFDGIEMPKT